MKSSAKTERKAANVREAHAKHENEILVAGQLYYMIAGGLFMAAATGVISKPWRGILNWPDTLWVAGVFTLLAGAYAVTAYGLRSLAGWSRFAAGGLALLCLTSLMLMPGSTNPLVLSIALTRAFAIPVGVIFTLYVAYLALSKKGLVVLSPAYRQEAAASPRGVYVFSKIFLVVAAILVVVQSLNVCTIFLGQMR